MFVREVCFPRCYLTPYLDGLSVSLNSLPVGCDIGVQVISADDVVLLSPSRKGLQKLVDHCVIYGEMLDISYITRQCKSPLVETKQKYDRQPPAICKTTIDMQMCDPQRCRQYVEWEV